MEDMQLADTMPRTTGGKYRLYDNTKAWNPTESMTGLWFAGDEGIETKRETIIMGYTGATNQTPGERQTNNFPQSNACSEDTADERP